jgi:DNA-binding transcriptional regulator YdaS (Cro superfamily)
MNLLTYRETHGLTQAAIAEMLIAAGYEGVNQSLVSQWERGALDISAEWCKRLEIVTKGECTRLDNRPDLFGPLMPSRGKRRNKS